MRHPDILVIGGGIIGASIAWRLACRGVSVLLCDARRLGEEASWAGAGMLVPGSEFDQPDEWLALGNESLALYPGFVRELELETGARVDFSIPGALEIAGSEADMAGLRLRAAAQRHMGVEASEVAPTDLPGILRPGLHGAILYPADGQVDPRTMMRALRAALMQRGVDIREGCPVESVRVGEHGVEARLPAAMVNAARCVLAAGAWSTSFPTVSGLPRAFPVRGHLAGYNLTPNTLPHILRFGHTYVVQRTTGYTIAGASVERVGFDRSVDAAAVRALDAAAHELAPGLLPSTSDEAWTGFRPGIEAPGPMIGRWENSPVWLAYGHYRNGILFAPATAERISRGIMASSRMDSSSPACTSR